MMPQQPSSEHPFNAVHRKGAGVIVLGPSFFRDTRRPKNNLVLIHSADSPASSDSVSHGSSANLTFPVSSRATAQSQKQYTRSPWSCLYLRGFAMFGPPAFERCIRKPSMHKCPNYCLFKFSTFPSKEGYRFTKGVKTTAKGGWLSSHGLSDLMLHPQCLTGRLHFAAKSRSQMRAW